MNRAVDRLRSLNEEGQLVFTSYHRKKYNTGINIDNYIQDILANLTLLIIDDTDFNFSFFEIQDVNEDIITLTFPTIIDASNKVMIKYKVDKDFFNWAIDTFPMVGDELRNLMRIALPNDERNVIVDVVDLALYVKKIHQCCKDNYMMNGSNFNETSLSDVLDKILSPGPVWTSVAYVDVAGPLNKETLKSNILDIINKK